MKIITFIISILLVSFIISESCNKEGVSSQKDCKDLTVSKDGNHCCFGKSKLTKDGKTEEYKACEEVTKEMYDNIKKYIDDAKKEMEDEGYTKISFSIDCASSYLQYYLASLLLLIIL